ncbi:rCG42143 [Rattus norvegicus]|uniref:RCG42143 n=1 Tax=Rattus norvegicus TaxID=10116 RepID=A6K0C5_RAT|nr:rCG42143 [Rattus norvegicus]
MPAMMTSARLSLRPPSTSVRIVWLSCCSTVRTPMLWMLLGTLPSTMQCIVRTRP